MSPTLNNDDLILVSYVPFLFKKPKINDIVAVNVDDKILIKRVKVVKKNKYLVEGDNKFDSFDSRRFGQISAKNILGKVIYKLK